MLCGFVLWLYNALEYCALAPGPIVQAHQTLRSMCAEIGNMPRHKSACIKINVLSIISALLITSREPPSSIRFYFRTRVFLFFVIFDKIRRRKLHETWRLARVYHALECILTSQKIIIIFAIVKATTKANRWATQRCYVHFVQWMRSIIMAMKMTHMNSIVIRLHTGFNHIGSNVPFNNGQDQPCHIKYYYRANNWCIIRNSSIKCFYKCFACFEQLGIFVRFLFLYCGQLGLQTDDCAQWCQQFNIFIFRFAASEQRA